MFIKEFRILMPLTVEEYGIAHLWSLGQASKNETGGNEGVEFVINEPRTDEELGKIQYTHKTIHLMSKVPSFIRLLAPSGSLEVHEKARNAYPYYDTALSNPYMKDSFDLTIKTCHKLDFGETENVHNISPELWEQAKVDYIDIVNDAIIPADYKVEEDPLKSAPKAEGRGPLTTDWVQRVKSGESNMPCMCVYKQVKCNFQWYGLQEKVENVIAKSMRRMLLNLHRQLYCWMDNWKNLTLDEIRKIEEQTKWELDTLRPQGSPRGMVEK